MDLLQMTPAQVAEATERANAWLKEHHYPPTEAPHRVEQPVGHSEIRLFDYIACQPTVRNKPKEVSGRMTRLPDKRNRTDSLADAGEVIAALPFGGELAEEALHGVLLGGIGGQGEGFAAGEFEEFLIAPTGLAMWEAEVAGLAGAEKFAGAAGGGDRFSAISKTVGGAHHGFEAGAGDIVLRPLSGRRLWRPPSGDVMRAGATRMQWDFWAPRPMRPRSWWSWARPKRSACSMTMTVALGTSTPTSTTVVATRIWASFLRKRCMTSSFSSLERRPCKRPSFSLGKTSRGEALVFFHGGFQLELRFFDDGIDDVSLMARGDFAAEKFQTPGRCCSVVMRVTIGVRAGRKLVENGNVEVAIEGQRERARNRRRRQHQDVRRVAVRSGFVHQALALEDAEAVLFINGHEAEPRELDVIFDQRMRADDELRFAGSNAFEDGGFFQLISGR